MLRRSFTFSQFSTINDVIHAIAERVWTDSCEKQLKKNLKFPKGADVTGSTQDTFSQALAICRYWNATNIFHTLCREHADEVPFLVIGSNKERKIGLVDDALIAADGAILDALMFKARNLEHALRVLTDKTPTLGEFKIPDEYKWIDVATFRKSKIQGFLNKYVDTIAFVPTIPLLDSPATGAPRNENGKQREDEFDAYIDRVNRQYDCELKDALVWKALMSLACANEEGLSTRVGKGGDEILYPKNDGGVGSIKLGALKKRLSRRRTALKEMKTLRDAKGR